MTMKLLLLNPNTSTEVTQLMMRVGQRAVSPGTELIPFTATRGVPYICLLYTSPSPRDRQKSRMPSSA